MKTIFVFDHSESLSILIGPVITSCLVANYIRK